MLLPGRAWEVDRALTPGTACSLIRSQFPRVDAEHVEYLGSGWEFDVYLTRDGWVFRFPRRAEYSTMFERESQVHTLVAPALASLVRVPRVELWGRSTSEFPYVFAAHRFVPGIRADDPEAPDSPDLAHRLGQVLGTLHSVPGKEASAAGVPLDPEGSAEWLDETLSAAGDLNGVSSVVDSALRWLREVRTLPDPYAGPPRLVHNDLCPDHLLVDPDSGRLIGLIDWTDASLGDPVLDFIVLATWRGASFVRSVLESYTPVDPNFRARLLFQARVRSLHWLHSAIEQGTDKEKHLRWVANAFDPNDYF